MENTISDEQIQFFRRTLLTWYRLNGRDFPWRKKGLKDYDYVIAEVLLQRTKAETVARFYLKFLKVFPSWDSLVNAEQSVLEEFLKPIGLYRQRSKRLISLAQEMVKRNAVLPKDREELESIPFVGQYIANAIELIIFNQPSPLVDVNMSRVLERFFGPRKLADIRYDPYLQLLSRKVVAHTSAKEVNWAILDFSALICTARSPDHTVCPLKDSCVYYRSLL